MSGCQDTGGGGAFGPNRRGGMTWEMANCSSNEELHGFCSLPHVVRMFKSRTMRLAGYVACMR